MQYIMFVVLQFTDALMSTVVLFDVALTFLQVWTKGQMGHFKHFFIHLISRFGLDVGFGTLDLISLSRIDLGLL